MEAHHTGDHYIRASKVIDGPLDPFQAYADRLHRIKDQRKSRIKGNPIGLEMLGQAISVPTLNLCLTASSHN